MDAAVATAVKVRKMKMLQACTGRWRCSSSWWSELQKGTLWGNPSIANLLPRKCTPKPKKKKHQQQTNKQNKTTNAPLPKDQTLPLLHSQVLSSKCAVQKNTFDKRKTDQTNSQTPKITEANCHPKTPPPPPPPHPTHKKSKVAGFVAKAKLEAKKEAKEEHQRRYHANHHHHHHYNNN